MTFSQAFFSFEGRLGRLPYFGWCVLLTTILLTAVIVLASTLSTQNFYLVYIPILIALWPASALLVKRLHDMEMPGGHAVWIMALQVTSVFVPSAAPASMPLSLAILGAGLWTTFTPSRFSRNAHSEHAGASSQQTW